MTRPCIEESLARNEDGAAMAAAAGDGEGVQVRTKESIPQDFGDGIDSSCYFCESPIFLSFVDAAVYRTSKLRWGDYGRCPRLSSCILPTGHYGRT